MKNLKISIFTAALALFTAAGITTMNSCKPDPCKDETCNDHGTPTEKDKKTCECVCNDGYEGDKCETMWSTKFAGSYNVAESGTGITPSNFSSSIEASTATTIKISNFGDSGQYLTCDLDGISSIKINNVSVTVAGDVFVVNGTGSRTGTTVTINYTVTMGGTNLGSYTDVYTK